MAETATKEENVTILADSKPSLKDSTHDVWDLPGNPADVWGDDFGDRKLVHMDDIIGQVVDIEGFDIREGSMGKYYSIYINGSSVVNSGSVGVMAKMGRVLEADILPVRGVFVRKELPNGNRLYSIVSPTAEATK